MYVCAHAWRVCDVCLHGIVLVLVANSQRFVVSGGGDTDTIKFLTDRGADPNSIGQFKRTPLYRAAFAGHLGACEVSRHQTSY